MTDVEEAEWNEYRRLEGDILALIARQEKIVYDALLAYQNEYRKLESWQTRLATLAAGGTRKICPTSE